MSVNLKDWVTCVYCWERFKPEWALWIAEHPDIPVDDWLEVGTGNERRFIPHRFTLNGEALDEKGEPCRRTACPHCHGEMPREVFEMDTVFWSIIGPPSCGKSYVLTAMTSQLRDMLGDFRLDLQDPNPKMNFHLNAFEDEFRTGGPDKWVRIDKTQVKGSKETQITVSRQGQPFVLARPFVFTLRPLDGHPRADLARQQASVICFYDNAGEHFEPGAQTFSMRAMNHIGVSGVLMFLFDPLLDPRFRDACRECSEDPQLADAYEYNYNQLAYFNELRSRVSQLRRYEPGRKHDGLLFVILTKYDVWRPLLERRLAAAGLGGQLRMPWEWSQAASCFGIDLSYIEKVSQVTRGLLKDFTPRMISAAEGFAQHVLYLPLSATGVAPEAPEDYPKLGLAFRPKNIKPVWVEVPALYALCRGTSLVLKWNGASRH